MPRAWAHMYTSGILQLGSTSAPSADDPIANVLGEVDLGERCLDGVKLVLSHFDVKVLPSSFSATDQHLSDDLGLCLHLVIAHLDVLHDMGGDTSHGVLAHDLALGQEVQEGPGVLVDLPLRSLGVLGPNTLVLLILVQLDDIIIGWIGELLLALGPEV